MAQNLIFQSLLTLTGMENFAMKQTIILLILFVFPFLARAQYYDNDQVLEKQFESSGIYFQRFYLNTFGLNHFSKVAPGFFDDPFTRLKLNPALGMNDTCRSYQFYFDYRSNRNQEVPQSFIRPMPLVGGKDRVADIVRPDPRWYRITIQEPEPVLSAGLRYRISPTYHFTAAYQLIYKEEPFYREPLYYYNLSPFYDAFNQSMVGQNVTLPVFSFQRQTDQTVTRAHFFAFYLAHKIDSSLSVGIGTDFVTHNRNADYLYLNKQTFSQSTYNSTSTDRHLKYHHSDFFVGLNWRAAPKWRLGIQAGMLSGKVLQRETVLDSTYYSYDQGFSRYHHLEISHFNHKGNRIYSTLSLQYSPDQKKKIVAFVNYAHLQNDLNNTSHLQDRNKYFYSAQNGLEYHLSDNTSTLFNGRSDEGDLNEHLVESMFSVKINETERTVMRLGFYYSYLNGQKQVTEPVLIDAYSFSKNEGDSPDEGHYSNQNTRRHREDKTLFWKYRYTRQSIQMPVYWWHKVNNNLAVFAIINKLWTAWRIKQTTDARYKEWYDLYDGQETVKKDFSKHYEWTPNRNKTDDTADFALGFEVNLVKNILLRYLINPDFENEMRISQWWLSIYATF